MNAGAMLEAVLLASPRPVSLRALASATGIPEGEALVAMGELGDRYSPDSSGIVLRGPPTKSLPASCTSGR